MGKSDRKSGQPVFVDLPVDRNEIYSDSGRKEPHYRKFLQGIAEIPGKELHDRQKFIDRATHELGRNADRMREETAGLGVFRMDLFPRILRSREWKQIEQGVLQRTRAFASYISDIHGIKKILTDGVIAPELVFEDPSFHPELHGIPSDDDCPITVGAIDLIRTTGGKWKVLENRFSSPTGISYVIQARRIQAQALPELFESQSV